MLKGILLVSAIAWLAVANPNGGNPISSANSTSVTSNTGASQLLTSPGTQVPEPSTLISFIFGVGLLGGVLLRLRSSR